MAQKQTRLLIDEDRKKRENIVNSKYKCSICGELISYYSRRGHLRKFHQIYVEDPNPYFLNKKQIREKEIEKRWKEYCKELSIPDTQKKDRYRCGEKVNGTPFVRVIYTPIESNRRKH